MRKAQKRQAEELVKQMQEAHEQIKRYMEHGDGAYATELLAECQNAGVALGTLIEESEGEGHPAVSALEEYCELAYKIHSGISDGTVKSANKAYKLLKQRLIKAENSLRNDVKIRKEVVFLPYKASMWDSLESVWKAADEDPDCDAYVIPISYYDKNPDESFGEMHYEADQYPDYVPITSYNEYDFEARNPDMIYIHNPYDECNIVTSVEPFFFSSNLKKFTDMLVYIPYFVLGEVSLDDDDAIEGMKHFCTTPGVFNADRVIVQSEDMKQVFIKVLMDYMDDHSEAAKRYWNNKILGLGSPKFDKVAGTKREEIKMLGEWLKIIEKPDGSRKKIIFYNTSVGALLRHDEKMLAKIKDVLRVFREKQDELALLWRPHPLMKTTISSMRPQLWEEYDAIVRNYIEEGWGIYDDTADMTRAIAASDAYYGDGSSVVELYKATGKPVMIQNAEGSEINWKGLFCTYKLAEGKGKVWFAAALFNSLFSIDLKNGEIEWEGKIPEETDGMENLFRDYIAVDDKLYFAPINAKNIAVYDTACGKFETYALDMGEYGENGNFANVLRYRDDLIFIGICKTNRICRFCIGARMAKDISTAILANLKVAGHGGLYGCKPCIRGDILYVPLLKGGCAFRVSLQTEEGALLKLAEEDDAAFSMAIYIPDTDVIWFVGTCGQIVQWDEAAQTKEEIKFSDCDDHMSEEYNAYRLAMGKLYLFPRKREKECKCIDVYTGRCVSTFHGALRVLDVQEINGVEYYIADKEDGSCYVGHINENGIGDGHLIHRKDNRADRGCFDEYQIHFEAEKPPVYYESPLNWQYRNGLSLYIERVSGDLDSNVKENAYAIGADIWKCQNRRA